MRPTDRPTHTDGQSGRADHVTMRSCTFHTEVSLPASLRGVSCACGISGGGLPLRIGRGRALYRSTRPHRASAQVGRTGRTGEGRKMWRVPVSVVHTSEAQARRYSLATHGRAR